MNRDPGLLREGVNDLRRQRRRPGEHQAHGPQAFGQILHRQPVPEDRGCHRDHADRLVLDQVEGAAWLEAVGQHQSRAHPKGSPEHCIETVDVEQRQHTEHHVVGGQHRWLDLGDLLEVGQQRPVAEHGRARATRRTTGVEQGCQRLGVLQRGQGTTPVFAELVVGTLPCLRRSPDQDHPR